MSQPVYGTIVNYRVGIKTQKPKECLIKFPQINSASSAGQLINKKVIWKQGKTKLSGKIFGVHHGIAVSLFLPYGIAFKARVTEKWKELCSIFEITIDNKSKDDLLKEFIQSLKGFIKSVDGPTCVKDIKDPIIEKENYFQKINKLVDYAMNDAVTLTSYRPINEELYKKIFEYAWDGRFIDF